MERITVSEEDVMATLREVVAERPEYVYACPEAQRTEWDTCFYVHNATEDAPEGPGCVVGVVLNRLGVPLDALKEHEGENAFTMVPKLLDTSRFASDALADAQAAQDNGQSWAEALAEAEAAFSAHTA